MTGAASTGALDGIAWTEAGQGAPALLFVHGYGCAREDWDAQVATLRHRHRCVAMDLPGHGCSAAFDRGTMPGIARTINALRRALRLDPVVLVGHSLGARNVIDACLMQPDGVAGLIFVDGRFYDGDPDELRPRIAALVEGENFVPFLRRTFHSMFTPGFDPATMSRAADRAASLDPAFGRRLFVESSMWDSTRGRDALAALRVPLLHIQSSDMDSDRRMISLKPDSRTPFMQTVARLVPGAELAVVPDTLHFPMLEKPDAVTALIAAFLDRLAGAAS